MSARANLARRGVTGLVRLSCYFALAALAIMAFAVISGKPLPVILSMSVGHGIGVVSILCFFLAVLMDAMPGAPRARSDEESSHAVSGNGDEKKPESAPDTDTP